MTDLRAQVINLRPQNGDGVCTNQKTRTSATCCAPFVHPSTFLGCNFKPDQGQKSKSCTCASQLSFSYYSQPAECQLSVCGARRI